MSQASPSMASATSGRTALPAMVRVAGLIWIIAGALNLAIAAVLGAGFATGATQQRVRDELAMAAVATPSGLSAGYAISEAFGYGGACMGIFMLLVGLVFLWVGVQTVRGRPKDTLGNGIGSLLFGALGLANAAVALVQGAAGGARPSIGTLVTSSLGAVALLVAGIMALAGRGAYLRWKSAAR